MVVPPPLPARVRWSHSLLVRSLVVITLWMVAVSVLVFGQLYQHLNTETLEHAIDDYDIIIGLSAKKIEQALWDLDQHEVNVMLEHLTSVEGYCGARVLQSDGGVFAERDWPALSQSHAHNVRLFTRDIFSESYARDGGPLQKLGSMQVCGNFDHINEKTRHLLDNIIMAMMIILAGMLVSYFYSFQIFFRPILSIGLSMQQLARSWLPITDPRLLQPNEIGHLARSFNLMVAELTQAQKAIQDEIQKSKHEADKNVLLRTIAGAANQAQNTDYILQRSLEEVCLFTGWAVGHCFLLEQATGRLISSRTWSFGARTRFAALVAETEKSAFKSGQELPGLVLQQRSAAWIDKPDQLKKFARGTLLAEMGLKGGAAFPIFIEDKVVGVAEFFATTPVQPDIDLANLMENIGVQIGRVIERGWHETALKQAMRKTEEAGLAKAEFLSNMSHELRTPMHAILNYAKMGGRDVEAGRTTNIYRYLGNIQIAGDRLLKLLNNLLDLAKLESGKMDYAIALHDLKEITTYAEVELYPLFQSKNLTFSVVCEATNTTAFFDPSAITQVLINLLSNAIKFSSPNATVRLRLKNAPDQKDFLQVDVVDEGVGVPDAELVGIFDKFVQSSKTKSGAGGTGLGLSICYQIITQHGGKIWAHHNTPAGAIFSFTLPARAN
ncbi:MAG: HAMP domain-containing protein [Alphaproteobacteria bacterium]|nr:HAMP domain-containing protein [Alphaproteobacteria bacterium]